MSEIHAAIGLEQLKKLPKFLSVRKKNFKYLKKKLEKHSNIRILDNTEKGFKNSYYCLNIVLLNKLRKKRLDIINYLKSKKIGTSIYYPQPVPSMTYYKKKYGFNPKNFINASEISDFSISIPVGPHINKKNLIYVKNNLEKIINKFNEGK